MTARCLHAHPHGLGILHAACRARGLECRLVMCRSLPGDEQFLGACEPYDVIGLGGPSWKVETSKRLAGLVRDCLPGKKIIAGGLHATISDEFQESGLFDHVFLGPAEITLPDFLEDGGGDWPATITCTKPTDLDAFPWMDRDAFDHPLEPAGLVGFMQCQSTATFMVMHGCPFRCRYCQPSTRRHYGAFRRRSAANLLAEMRDVVIKYDPEGLIMLDDTAIFADAWSREFVASYAEIRKPLWVASRADIICKAKWTFRDLANAGLAEVSIGLESGSQRMLDFMEKGTTVEQNIRACQFLAEELGLRVWANIMVGLPTETPEELEETDAMVQRTREFGNIHYSPTLFSPYPGSYLGDEAIASGDSIAGAYTRTRHADEGPRLHSQAQWYDAHNHAIHRWIDLSTY